MWGVQNGKHGTLNASSCLHIILYLNLTLLILLDINVDTKLSHKLVVSTMWIFLGEARQPDILPCAVCSGGDRRLRVARSYTQSDNTSGPGVLRLQICWGLEICLRHKYVLRHRTFECHALLICLWWWQGNIILQEMMWNSWAKCNKCKQMCGSTV